MIAWARPLASTMPTGSRMSSANPSATSGQTTDTRRVQRRREASSPGIIPPRTSASPTIRELPSAAANSVE